MSAAGEKRMTMSSNCCPKTSSWSLIVKEMVHGGKSGFPTHHSLIYEGIIQPVKFAREHNLEGSIWGSPGCC